MKRTLLLKTLLRIAFTTMLTSNLTLKLAAHDLPSDAKSYAMARSRVVRLTAESHAPPSTLLRKTPDSSSTASAQSTVLNPNTTSPNGASPGFTGACFVADWLEPSRPESRRIGGIDWRLPAGRFATSKNRFQPAFCADRLSTNAAIYGKAEPEAATTIRNRPSSRWIEEYRPYDFSVRDWRFTPPRSAQQANSAHAESSLIVEAQPLLLKEWHTTLIDLMASRFAQSLEVVQRASHSVAMAAAKSQLQHLKQAVVTNRFARTRNVIALLSTLKSPLSSGASLAVQRVAIDLKTLDVPSQAKPYFTTPPFVYFENMEGLRLVLTREQASARGLILDPNFDRLARANSSQPNELGIPDRILQQSKDRISNFSSSLRRLSDRASQLWSGLETQSSTRIARESTLIQ